MRPVKSKKDFVQRYAEGEFGNRSPTWSVEEFLANTEADYEDNGYDLFHLRNRTAGGSTHYNLNYREIRTAIERIDPSGWYVSAMAPTNLTLFQGEVRDSPEGLELLWTTVRKPMRDALREESSTAYRIEALGRLRTFLDTRSLDWLSWLLWAYPGHVVEFSTYSRCWGVEPGYNTVFWEVRLY